MKETLMKLDHEPIIEVGQRMTKNDPTLPPPYIIMKHKNEKPLKSKKFSSLYSKILHLHCGHLGFWNAPQAEII